MNYKIWMLERLIEKFENSRRSAGGESRRKIAVRLQHEKAVTERMESAEEKEQFLEALAQLKECGLIDYSWVKYEKGNLIERVWLIPEDDKIRECYDQLGRIPKSDVMEDLDAMIGRFMGRMKIKEDLHDFLGNIIETLRKKRSIPRFFTEDLKLDKEILEGLLYLADNEEEVLERVFSTRLYGDSKAFEKRIKGKVLSVLRFVGPEREESPSDEELLRERGVVKWPEILEFTGNVQILLRNGANIDYGKHEYGAYINSATVKEAEKVFLNSIHRVMFIENKANYIWYIAHEKKEEELVLYHGGCYSPIKGIWFRKLCAAGREEGKQISFFHWSDIDAGGFRIFTRLQCHIVPELQPYRMDSKTLINHKEKGISLENQRYRALLRKMAEDPQYEIFQEVIREMLKLDLRLEQEALI